MFLDDVFDRDEWTWVGHGVQAILIVMLWGAFGHPVAGLFASETHFTIREVGDALDDFREFYRNTPSSWAWWDRTEIALLATWYKVREDGLMDHITPHFTGIATALIWVGF